MTKALRIQAAHTILCNILWSRICEKICASKCVRLTHRALRPRIAE